MSFESQSNNWFVFPLADFRQERESYKILFYILKIATWKNDDNKQCMCTHALLLFIRIDTSSITTLLRILVLHLPLSVVIRFHSCNTFDLSRESLRALLRATSLTHSARDRPRLTPQINFDLDLPDPFSSPLSRYRNRKDITSFSPPILSQPWNDIGCSNFPVSMLKNGRKCRPYLRALATNIIR